MSEKILAHSNRRLPGKMHRWQRLASFWMLGICFASGLAWFIGLDWLQIPVPKLRLWWVLHGCSSLLGILLIGAALPQHLIVTWKARRNIGNGILVVVGFSVVLLSALALLYAPEEWRDTVHWVHCIPGIVLVLLFPLHIIRGRFQARHK